MIEDRRLAEAAYHTERVASRKLAARSSIPQADALRLVLEQKAGPAGLAALLASRDAEKVAQLARIETREQARRLAESGRRARHTPDPTRWNAWFDGSAKPNPGPCAIGAVLLGPGGQQVDIGRPAGYGSSSEAEYLALIAVLETGVAHGVRQLTVHGDSRVVLDDMVADDRAAAPSLASFRSEARRLATQIGDVRFQWIPRHRNARADRLAHQGHR